MHKAMQVDAQAMQVDAQAMQVDVHVKNVDTLSRFLEDRSTHIYYASTQLEKYTEEDRHICYVCRHSV